MKTTQRQIIYSYLKNNKSHPTARDIYEAISKKGCEKISFATVYNTLALMKKKGLVREVAIINFDQKRYDPIVTPHVHLICGNCGQISDVLLPVNVEIPDEHRQGFVIQDREVNFYGLCSVCKNKDKKTSTQHSEKKAVSSNRRPA